MEHIGSIIPRVLQDIQRRTKPMSMSVTYEDGRSILRYCCDYCHRDIIDAELAMVAWWMREGDNGAGAGVFHKPCLDMFERKSRAVNGPGMLATEELVDAHFYLGHNCRITEKVQKSRRELMEPLEQMGF